VDLAEDLVGILGPGKWARVIVPPSMKAPIVRVS
jgi:hypothetical protein